MQKAEAELVARADPKQVIHVSRCDLAEPSELRNWVDNAAAALGGVDSLVCMATGQATDSTEVDWKVSFDIDLMAPVRLIEAALPRLTLSPAANILLIASRTALEPAPAYTAYATLKAAVVHLTRSKAAALRSQGIRVNCVAPGSTEYPGGLWARLKSERPDAYARTARSMPGGRLATPADIVPAMVFLCSPAARWITGQILLVDGGQTLPGSPD